MLRKSISWGLLGLVTVCAQASPTVLNFMPVADVLAHKNYYLGGSVSANGRNLNVKHTRDKFLEFGLFDRFEFGVDRDIAGDHVWNYKVKLVDDTKNDFGLAFGAQSMNKGSGDPFVAVCKGFGGVRLHAAYCRMEREYTPAVGAEIYTKGFHDTILYVEHFVGSGNASYVGAAMPIYGGIGVYASLAIPNHKAGAFTHTIGLAYLAPF